jgi:hypothetical protein
LYLIVRINPFQDPYRAQKTLNLRQKTQFVGIVATKINERGSATFFLDFQNIENKSALVIFGLGANAD